MKDLEGFIWFHSRNTDSLLRIADMEKDGCPQTNRPTVRIYLTYYLNMAVFCIWMYVVNEI